MKTPVVSPRHRCVLVKLLLKSFIPLTLTLSSLLFLLAAPNAHAQVDLDFDNDDLLDAWEIQHFGALNDPDGDATDDPDGDGCDNLAECNAGTSPLDATDCLTIVSSSFDPANAVIDWPSIRGKRYRIQTTTDLSTWVTLSNGAGTTPIDFRGTGGQITADFTTPASPSLTGGLSRDFWSGFATPYTVVNFKTNYLNWSDPLVPAAPEPTTIPPSGTEWLSSTKAPSNVADQYAQRLHGFLTPKTGGDYTFYVTGRHQCEIWLSTDENPLNVTRVSYLTNANVFEEEDWDYLASNGLNDTQKSAPVTLTAGTRYYIAIFHIHNGQWDHLAAGWEIDSNPGVIEIIPADCLSPYVDLTDNNADPVLAQEYYDSPANTHAKPKFARVITYGPLDPTTDTVNADAFDADGDGVDDATEMANGGFNPYLAQSANSGQNDALTLSNAGAANPASDTLSIAVNDATAREIPGIQNNGLPTIRDVARFRITRNGSLTATTAFFTISATVDPLKGRVSDPDYIVTDQSGGVLTPSSGTYAANIPAGNTGVTIEIVPVLDEIVEYPEEVNVNVPAFAVSAIAAIHDAPDDPRFDKYYIGEHAPELAASGATDTPTGASFLILNGSNRVATLDDQYGVFDPGNNETQSHIHRASISGNTIANGPVIHTIPSGQVTVNRYLLENFTWNLNDPEGSGLASVQDRLDSLEYDNAKQFPAGRVPAPNIPIGASGVPPLYVNVHTTDFGSGQIWALFRRANASTDDPSTRVSPAPPIEPIDYLTEESKLRREIRRFLTQATFGPTQQTEEEMFNSIVNDHDGDRIAAYDAWLTAQWALPQTLVTDLLLALDMQEWVTRGYWEAGEYESGSPPNGGVVPATWPNFTTQDISGFDSLNATSWRTPDQDYPVSQTNINNARFGTPTTGEVNAQNRTRAIWTVYCQAQDQLRQRVGFALSEIMVVSAELAEIDNHHLGAMRYLDMLGENADDHFRELLEDVTYSPVMGKYLSHLQNSSETSTGVPPDENYAREIMQLFSIGLLELWDDGFIKLDGANKNITQTYGNDEITGLARVMTGLSWSTNSGGQTDWDTPNIDNTNPTSTWYDDGAGNKYYSSRYNYPMAIYNGEHDNDPKTIAGAKVISNNGTPDGRYTSEGDKDLGAVHNYFAGTRDSTVGVANARYAAAWSTDPAVNHQNPPAFISRRLIQRLVTSNPSSDYIYRVATVFRNTNGQLDQVVRAILLDPEARNISDAEFDIEYGKKKEPLLAYIHAVRALNARSELAMDGSSLPIPGQSTTPTANGNLATFEYPQLANFIGTTQHDGTGAMVVSGGVIQNNPATQLRFGRTDTSTSRQLRQTPFYPPTVFNWFLPDYQPAGLVASYGLFAPEFQVADENAVIQNVNMYWQLGWSTNGENGGPIGGSTADQQAEGYNTNSEDIRTSYEVWYDKYNNYTADGTLTGVDAELDRDLQLVDELDDLLCGGRLKLLYPFDQSDDGAPVNEGSLTGGNAWPPNLNPREVIAWAMHDSYSTASTNVDEKVRLALYLIMSTPEFLVQK